MIVGLRSDLLEAARAVGDAVAWPKAVESFSMQIPPPHPPTHPTSCWFCVENH
jgi:hypothetical protein